MRHHRPNHWQIRQISIFYDVFTVSIPNTEHISHIVTHLSSKYLHVTFSILIIQIICNYFCGDDLNIFLFPFIKIFSQVDSVFALEFLSLCNMKRKMIYQLLFNLNVTLYTRNCLIVLICLRIRS